MSTIGERTKLRREDMGISQPELSDRVNAAAGEKVCSQQSVQQLESGHTARPRYLNDLAFVLGVSVNWLLGKTEVRDPDPEEIDAMEMYLRLTPREQKAIKAQMASLLESKEE